MSEHRIGPVRLRTWPVVALALFGLITLIVISLLAARGKADEAYAQLDNINTRYRNVESRLRRLRSDLHLSGILVRDYLLDTTATTDYRARLMEFRDGSNQILEELAPLVRSTDPVRYDLLRKELDQYWRSYEPLFDHSLTEERYEFLRREVVPRRDAVMTISAEIENINNATLSEEHAAAAARQYELRQYLTSMLAASLSLGLIVAIAAVIRIRLLERRSDEQHARTEQAGQEMRRLSNQLVKTQEAERKKLSRELHDEVGQMLTALRMELGRAERAHAVGSPVFAATIAEGKALIDRMMRLVRDLAMGLRPSMLDDLGLEPALAWQTRDFSRRYNVPVDLHVDGDLERLPDSHRTCVYRVVQEALTNCAKHAGATEINVTIRGGSDRLDLTVSDNGVGIDASSGHSGLGLTGIKERIKEMNGTASIERGPTGGTILQATLRFLRLMRPGGHLLRILLGDDHGIVRRGMKALLDAETDVEVVGEAADGMQALKMCDELRPDVLILDIAMPKLNGIDVAERAVKHNPSLKVLFLSMYADESYVLRALSAGARGYLLKDATEQDLVPALRTIMQGRPFFSPAISAMLLTDYMRHLQQRGQEDSYGLLTDREKEVLHLLAEGRTNKEVAALLDVGVSTIETHRANLMQKLGLHNTAEIVLYAVRKSLVS